MDDAVLKAASESSVPVVERGAATAVTLGNRCSPIVGALAGFVLLRSLFALLVYMIHGWAGFIHDDSASYVDSAYGLLHGSFSRDGAPEILRTPGYPTALVPVVMFRHFELAAVIENIGLSAVCAWLMYRIVKYLFPNSKAAVVAVFLYCFEPLSLLYSVKIVSEPLFCAQLLAFVFLTIRFFDKPDYRLLLAASLVAASTAYTRPITIFLGLWLVPTLLLFPRVLSFQQRLTRAMVFAATFGAVLLPWLVRNHVVTGYQGFSGTGDYNLYFYSAAAVRARVEHESFAELADASKYLEAHPEQRTWTEAQRFLFQRKTARSILIHHPWTYLMIHLKGCAVVLLDPGIMEVKIFRLLPQRTGLVAYSQDRGVTHSAVNILRSYPAAGATLALLEVWLLIYYFLAVRGMPRLAGDVSFFLISLVSYLVLVAGGPIAIARYRMPIILLLCIPASLNIIGWGRERLKCQDSLSAHIGIKNFFLKYPASPRTKRRDS